MMTYRKLLTIVLFLTLGGCAGNISNISNASKLSAKSIQIPTIASLAQKDKGFLYLAAQNAIQHGQLKLAIQFLSALIKKSPEARHPRMQLIKLLLRTNQPESAIVYINTGMKDTASAATPEEAAPHILHARALGMMGRREDALKILSLLLSNQPGLAQARLLHISLLVNLKKTDEAHFSIIVGLRNHETVQLRKVQAELLLRQNRLDEAVKSLEAMHKLDPENETSALLMSQIAMQQKNTPRAERLLQQHLEQYPNAVAVRHALGRLLVQSSRPEKAITVYKRLVRDTGGTTEILSSLGLLYYQQKDYENAVNQFRRVLKNTPDDQSNFYLAASLEAMGSAEEAKQVYAKIDKKSTSYIDAQLRLAGLELFAGNVNRAEKQVKAIISEFSDSEDAYMLLSSIYLRQKEYRLLLDETETALVLPYLPARLLMNRAIAYEHFKQYDGIKKSLKQLLDKDPDFPDALNFLGYVYAEQGIKLVEAESLIQRALKQKPDDGYYLDSLAWVYFKQGNYNKAIKIQTKALLKITDDAIMFEHMGDMFWKNGDKERARSNWEKSLQFDHDKPEKVSKKIAEGLASE